MGPRGKAVIAKFIAQSRANNERPLEIDKNYLLIWDMPKSTQLTIQRGYAAFKERFSGSDQVPFDTVFYQLENAYLNAVEKSVYTTLHIKGEHIMGLFVLLGLMIDQDFIDDKDALELERCLLKLFDSLVLA